MIDDSPGLVLILVLLGVLGFCIGLCFLSYWIDPGSWSTQTTVIHGHCIVVTTHNWLGSTSHVQMECR